MFFKNSKSKFILHIGTNKTGTTAIQTTLFENPNYLHNHGFCYPDIGMHNHGHHDFVRYLKGADPTHLNLSPDWKKKFQTSVNEYEKVIFSSELFYTIENPKDLYKLFPKNKTSIVIYIREHLSFLISWYQQAVQLRNITCSFKEYVDFHYCQLDYDGLISKWKEAYGSSNVKIETFDRNNFRNNNIVEDFFEKIQLPFDSSITLKKESNKSIAGNLLFFKLLINNFIDDDNDYKLAYEIARLSELDPSFSGKINIDSELGNAIRRKYRNQRYKLKLKHGLSFNLSELENSVKHFYNLETMDENFNKILTFAKKNNFKLYERIPSSFLKKFHIK